MQAQTFVARASEQVVRDLLRFSCTVDRISSRMRSPPPFTPGYDVDHAREMSGSPTSGCVRSTEEFDPVDFADWNSVECSEAAVSDLVDVDDGELGRWIVEGVRSTSSEPRRPQSPNQAHCGECVAAPLFDLATLEFVGRPRVLLWPAICWTIQEGAGAAASGTRKCDGEADHQRQPVRA